LKSQITKENSLKLELKNILTQGLFNLKNYQKKTLKNQNLRKERKKNE